MTTQIQLRRDSAANWASEDPVLAAGEPGYITDTGELRIGDGASAFSALEGIGLATTTGVVKPANTARTTAVSSDDPHLVLPVEAGGIYIAHAVLMFSNPSGNPDAKAGIKCPAASTGAATTDASPTSVGSTEVVARRLVSTVVTGGGGSSAGVIASGTHTGSPVHVYAGFTAGANGSCVVEWSQNGADGANATTLLAGSHLILTRVG